MLTYLLLALLIAFSGTELLFLLSHLSGLRFAEYDLTEATSYTIIDMTPK